MRNYYRYIGLLLVIQTILLIYTAVVLVPENERLHVTIEELRSQNDLLEDINTEQAIAYAEMLDECKSDIDTP